MSKTASGTKLVTAKGKCCKDRPRCKRCPVVLKRLETAGLAERVDKRTYILIDVTKPQLAAARRNRPIPT